MALGDRLAELERTMKGTGCSFGEFLISLPDDTREVLARLLSSPTSNENLRVALAKEGHRFSRDTIANHRHDRCLCAMERKGNA